MREWLTRFVDTGLQLEVRDVMVAGPPWNLRIATCFRDELNRSDGPVNLNEGMFYDCARWGRIVRHESHEDTQRVLAFDDLLSEQ